jgi:ABC-type multidrug transport system fused ATPase/permease subunit
MAQFFVTFLVDVLGSVLLLGGTVAVLTFADVRLGVALGVFVAVVGLLLVRVQHYAIPTATAAREADARLFGDLEEQLGMAEDLRANGAGHHIVRRHHEVSAAAFRANRRAQMVGAALIRLVNIAFTIGTLLLLALGVVLLRADAISLGTTLVLFQYSQLIRRPLERIIDQLKEMQAAQAGAARAAQLLALQPTITEPDGGGRPLPEGPLSIELRGVTFAYGDEDDVLHDIDLHVGAGRSLGLVGRTGSGKTTIGRLVLRLHDPTRGSVLVGGVDLRDVAFADLRSRIAVVTQEVQLFAASVRENVTLFRPDLASDDTITEVLGELGLGPWLAALPDGLDTELGPGGAGLSAGEAQLLAFARAFVADPAVVVLDEASSRLDPATESLLELAIDRLLAGRTAIVIAHRLASLDRMDEIAVLDDGRIVEIGQRDELARDPSSRFAQLLEAAR